MFVAFNCAGSRQLWLRHPRRTFRACPLACERAFPAPAMRGLVEQGERSDQQEALLAQGTALVETVVFGVRAAVEDPSWECFYEHGFKVIQAHQPDLMVIDSSTYVGFDHL